MTGLPEITVTMLGGTGSGKTVFLHGMYAVLSGGFEGYYLHTTTHDLDADLSDAWDKLLDDGELPPATTEMPHDYPLVFKDGLTPLLNINWQDYRGGAMSDREATSADTAQLIERLRISDCIYLTIDGRHLADGVDDYNKLLVRRRTQADRMAAHLQRTATARGGHLPPLVVLITKADLLIADGIDGPAALERAVDAIGEILPIAFERDVTTMICPVSLGTIGIPAEGERTPIRARSTRAGCRSRWCSRCCSSCSATAAS